MFNINARKLGLKSLGLKSLSLPLCVTALYVVLMSPAQALTDPTRPSSYATQTKKQRLNLESILYSSARKVAVINGTAVVEGGHIGASKIVSINKDSVKIVRGGKTSTLQLRYKSIRQEN